MAPGPQQIRDCSFGRVVFFWILGAIWLCISAVVIVGTAQDWNVDSRRLLFIAGLLAIGVLILFPAIYFTLRATREGRSVFDSPMLPAVCGGVVTGTIRLSRPLIYREPLQLRLACILQGDANESPTALLWEDQCTLDRFTTETRISEIPVHFRIPADCRPTRSGISWRLDAKAKTQRGHFSASFRIPLTAGPVQPKMLEIADSTIALRSPAPVRHAPVGRYLHFTRMSGGGSRVELLPGRNFLAAGFSFALALFCIGFAQTFRFHLKATDANDGAVSCFIVAASAIGSTMFFIGLRLALLKTTITVRDAVISIDNTLGVGSRRREIRAADITDISVKVQGSVQNTLFYSISAVRIGKRPTKICGAIYDKGDADWLAAEFKRELMMG